MKLLSGPCRLLCPGMHGISRPYWPDQAQQMSMFLLEVVVCAEDSECREACSDVFKLAAWVSVPRSSLRLQGSAIGGRHIAVHLS